MSRAGLHLLAVPVMALGLLVVLVDMAFLRYMHDNCLVYPGSFLAAPRTVYDYLAVGVLYLANFAIFWAAWWIRYSLRTLSQAHRQSWPPGAILFSHDNDLRD